jgi:hypothetical protein
MAKDDTLKTVATIAAVGVAAWFVMKQTGGDQAGTGISINMPSTPNIPALPSNPFQGLEMPSLDDTECNLGNFKDPLNRFPKLNTPDLSMPSLDIPDLNIPSADNLSFQQGKYKMIQGSVINVAGEEYAVVPQIIGVNETPLQAIGRFFKDLVNPLSGGLFGAISRHIEYGSPMVDIMPMSEWQQGLEVGETEAPSWTPVGREPTAIEKQETDIYWRGNKGTTNPDLQCEGGHCNVGTAQQINIEQTQVLPKPTSIVKTTEPVTEPNIPVEITRLFSKGLPS